MNITLTNPAALMAALAGTAPVTLSVDGVTDLTVTVIEPEPPPAPDLDLPADVLLGWYRCRAIRVGQEGDLALTYSNGMTGTIWAVKEGETILIQASKIMATTTAGKISVYP